MLMVLALCSHREDDKALADAVVDACLSSTSVIDFIRVATLGIGGFGRVELVRWSVLTVTATVCDANLSLIIVDSAFHTQSYIAYRWQCCY